MAVGILGTKLGMTQVFDEEGRAIPVTVVQAGPCTVTQIKSKQTDGYSAIQVGYGETTTKAINKPELGHLVKSSAPPLRHLREYRIDDVSSFELGQQMTVEGFTANQIVDVTGITIGRGFAGYQKRHNFKRGPMSHGSKNHTGTRFYRCRDDSGSRVSRETYGRSFRWKPNHDAQIRNCASGCGKEPAAD